LGSAASADAAWKSLRASHPVRKSGAGGIDRGGPSGHAAASPGAAKHLRRLDQGIGPVSGSHYAPLPGGPALGRPYRIIAYSALVIRALKTVDRSIDVVHPHGRAV